MLRYATALRSTNLQQRRSAVKELTQMGPSIPEAALAFLVPLLEDEDSAVREGALVALASAGPHHPAALESALAAVGRMLASPIRTTRMRGVSVIVRLGPAAHSLMEILAAKLRDSNIILSRMAAEALAAMGPMAAPTLRVLRDDADPCVRRQAQWALQKLDNPPRKSVPTQPAMRASLETPVGLSQTERVPLTMPPNLQRTEFVPTTARPRRERRQQPRFRCEGETFYRFLPDRGTDLWWKAEIRDVSATGIGLLTTRKANAGTRLAIDLEEAGVRRRAVADVTHCEATPAGWRLGCRFVGPLLPEDLQRLRETD